MQLNGRERIKLWAPRLGFLPALSILAVTSLVKAGSVSLTYDERVDLAIVRCYASHYSMAGCEFHFNQPRLPYYIHALIQLAFGNSDSILPHVALSFAFAAATIVLLFTFARRRFGFAVAGLTSLGLALSPAFVASARLIVTHSEAIFTTFMTLMIVFLVRAREFRRPSEIVVSATCFGATVASSMVGVLAASFVPIYVVLAWRPVSRREWILLALYPLIAFGVFTLLSWEQAGPSGIARLVQETIHGAEYPYWNYLELGSARMPLWYPFLLMAVKLTPWWTAALLAFPLVVRYTPPVRHDPEAVAFMTSLLLCIVIALTIQGAVVGYAAPHHQVAFFPWAMLAASWTVVTAFRSLRAPLARTALALVFVAGLAVQAWQLVQFFPHYLFYGAQYGRRFVGEFYGPAVLHCYGRNEILHDVQVLESKGARFLKSDVSCFGDVEATTFSTLSPTTRFDFALADYLNQRHLRFGPEQEAYLRFVETRCRPWKSYRFPTDFEVYALLDCRSR